LKESEQRIKDLTTLSDSLRSELASTMQNLQRVIANQKETIDALTLQVETLTAENSALRDTLENMSTISNTVYYVVGTKDELEQKGIIQEEGGASAEPRAALASSGGHLRQRRPRTLSPAGGPVAGGLQFSGWFGRLSGRWVTQGTPPLRANGGAGLAIARRRARTNLTRRG